MRTHFTIDRLLEYSFHALFFLTPLLYYTKTYELFEYNKMMFVYLMATIIGGLWLLKSITTQRFALVRTPLDIPILLYVGATILTSIISIDRHTSFIGYYSRFNGGLLSLVAYVLLYYAFVYVLTIRTNQDNSHRVYLPFLRTILTSTALVSVYAVYQRLGFENSSWVQDVQARVFASLGQPNWLAAYLAMVIPLNLWFLYCAATTRSKIVHLSLFILNYWAFTFTYSRGGTLGLAIGLLVFYLLSMSPAIYHFLKSSKHRTRATLQPFINPITLAVCATLLATFFLFGSGLTRQTGFQGIVNQLFPPATTPGNSLEGPTESSQIRLIVWQGAWEIFKHHPLLGTGNETFAYAYYQYRPQTHNTTTEWDFLYNKAHNEYLNELATKGLVGLSAYVLLIGTIFTVPVQKLFRPLFATKIAKQSKRPLAIDQAQLFLVAAILTAITTYLVQNIFSFSVVAINVLFFLLPAILWQTLHTSERKLLTLKEISLSIEQYKLARISSLIGVLLLVVTCFLTLGRYWLADITFAHGYNAAVDSKATTAYESIAQAVALNDTEPLYKSHLGYIAALLAESALSISDETLTRQLQDDALLYTKLALATSPNNTSFLRTAAKTYAQLALLDPTYEKTALSYAKKVVLLSPTDPSDRLRLAQFSAVFGNPDEAKKAYEEAITLKPDYRDARIGYAEFLLSLPDQANPQLRKRALDEVLYILERIASPDAEAEQLAATLAAQESIE